MTRLLGIDVGTTGVRAAVFDEAGALLGDASVACPHEAPAPGWAEADPERWWDAASTTCRELAARGLLTGVAAVGVTGQAPTAVLVDREGAPVRRAMLWLDVRAATEARSLDATLGPEAVARGGNRMHAYFLGPKLAWLRAHEPDALRRATWVLQSHAFLALRLTGEAACDPSTAMLCAPLFDADAGVWSGDAAKAVGVAPALLPPVARAHAVLGTITPAASAHTGLAAGTPVVGGGGDFAASALGVGVVDPGEACLMLGTAGNLLLPMSTRGTDLRLIQSHHVGCDRWLALSGTLCGAALAWFRRTCAPEASWEAIEAEAAAVPVGAEGVVMLPYLQGERTPLWDEEARGSFHGLALTSGRGHLARALYEGIALGFAHGLTVARQSGAQVTHAVAANGAGKSALLRQTLADALGIPVTWSSDRGATVAGAALLAGLGVGVVENVGVAKAWWSATASPHHHLPDPRAHERLNAVLARRNAIYEAELAARTRESDTL